jgi:two-component system chemotaxis response regulator CheY
MVKAKLEILVVDDQPVLRTLMKNQLRAMGYNQICEAGNGRAAFEIMKSQDISLVISDYNMPYMNGCELLEAVRQDTDLTGTPFIMVSGDANLQQINKAVSFKVDQFILKPFTLQVLEEKIHEAVH